VVGDHVAYLEAVEEVLVAVALGEGVTGPGLLGLALGLLGALLLLAELHHGADAGGDEQQ
jgi:hypothetical protein